MYGHIYTFLMPIEPLKTLEQKSQHYWPTCCRGNQWTRWAPCVCPLVCPGRALPPVPASATLSFDREAVAAPSPARVDGQSPSAVAEWTTVEQWWGDGRGIDGGR